MRELLMFPDCCAILNLLHVLLVKVVRKKGVVYAATQQFQASASLSKVVQYSKQPVYTSNSAYSPLT